MLFIILCFMLSGVVINYCIILYIFTGVYWQKHDSIRKCVRVSATLSQFFLFTMVTCIVKRALYYRDERRFSDKFWRRLVAVVCPMVSNRSIESLQGKMVEQSSSENQPKEKWYITLTNFGRKYWSYLIVAMLFIGKCRVFFAIIKFKSMLSHANRGRNIVVFHEFRFLMNSSNLSLLFKQRSSDALWLHRMNKWSIIL